MSVFGDFTLLEALGASSTADRYKAMHQKLGGPFFLKIYRRLPPTMLGPLQQRGDRLIGLAHPNLAPHLGHGVVDGIGFSVSPWLDGIDLAECADSLRDRRVHLTLDHCLLLLGDLAGAVAALHQAAATPTGSLLAHGAVSIGHVRVGLEGQVWLTGLCTPRGLSPEKPPEARFDLAGVGALMYDLVPLLRGGSARPPLPTILDRVIRRALGIGPASEHLGPVEFAERLGEVFQTLKLNPDRAPLVELVQRTIRAVEKRLAEHGGRSSLGGSRSPADAIPELSPVAKPGGAPALLELQPLSPIRPPAQASPVSQMVGATNKPGPTLGTPLPPVGGTSPDKPLISMLGRPPSLSATDPSFLTGSARGATPPPQPGLPSPPPGFPPPPPAQTAPAPAPPGPPKSPFTTPAAPFAPPKAPFASAPAPTPPVPVAPPVSPSGPFGNAPFPTSPTSPASPFGTPNPAPAPAPSPRPAPRPATMPHMAVPAAASLPDGAALFDSPRSGPRALLADAEENSSAGRARPPFDLGASTEGPAILAPPPNIAPPPPQNPALGERTDPDATRPIRVEAQKALPAVQALLSANVIDQEQLERAAAEQASRGGRTLEILVAHGACSDVVVADTLAVAAKRTRMPDAELQVREQALLRRLPQTYALARRILPLALDGGSLILAMADPFDIKVIEEVRELVHALDVDVRVAARAPLTQATLKAFADLHGKDVHQSGPRVLLGIQDDDTAQKLGTRLAQEGMQVEHVVDGAIARQILQTRPPDALICSYNLPGVDGQGLLLAARTQEKTLELPVYIMGPRSDDDLMSKVLDLGADDYFGEPVRPDVVVAKLRRAVGKMRGGPSTMPPVPATPPPPSTATATAAPPPLPPRSAPPPRRPAVEAPPPAFDEFGFDDLPDLPPEFDADTGPEVPAMPTGVMGTLRQMALPEIVQSLEMGRKTASVDIVPQDGEKGSIAFEGGAIRFAECGELTGDAAFFALMRHKEGFFRIHYGDAPKSINIESPTTYLLLEAMRLMDEEGFE